MAFIRNVDKLIEGLENKFFTEARAKAALAPELAAEESARLAGDSAEAAARESADNALDARLDVIEGSGEGSVAKAEQDAKDYADQKVAELVNSAPEVLNTLKELSDALGSDPNFATTVSNQIGAVDDKVDQEILDRQSAVSAEQSARESADQALDGRLDILEQDPTTKSYVDGEVLDLQGQITQEISDRQAAVEAEEDARELADNNLSGRISTLEADPTTKTYVDGQVSSLDGRLDIIEGADSVEGSVAKAEKDAKDYADSLNSAMDMRVDVLEQDPTTKSYVDGEVLDLQGQIDAEESRAMSAESALDGRLDILEQDPTTKAYVDQEVSAEESRAMSAESALDARLDIIEGLDSVEGSVAKAEKDAKDYADSLNSAMDARVDVLEQDPTTKAYVDAELSSEEQRAMSAEAALDGRLDVLEQDPTTKAYVDGIQSALDSRLDVLESDPVTKSYVDGEVSNLQGQVNTEKGRIDAILSAADADKDSFAEIVQLINSVDTSNDSAFASYVLSNDAALAQEISDREADVDAEETRALAAEGLLDGRLDVLESDPTTKSYVDSEVSAEESRAMSAESALDSRLDIIEGLDSVEGSVAKAEKDAKDYADSLNSAMDSRVDVLEADPTTKSYVDSQISSEASARSAEDLTMFKKDGSRNLEGNLLFSAETFNIGASAANRPNNLYVKTSAVINGITISRGNSSLSSNYLIGNNSLAANTTGISNIAFGNNSLTANTTGQFNIAIGNSVLNVLTVNSNNTAIGSSAAQYNTAGNGTFVGWSSGQGQSGTNATGNNNVGFGMNTVRYLSTGASNTALGQGAMVGSAATPITGNNNVSVGQNSGAALTSGSNNIFIGQSTGNTVTSGGGNIMLGQNLQPSSATASNEINIGNTYKATSSLITLNKDVEMVSGQKVKYSQKAVDYTLVSGDYIIAVSDLSVSRVMTLPSAVTMGAGKTFIIKEQSGSASQTKYIQIAPQSGEQIDGQADYKVVMPYESVMLVSNGSHWFII